MKPLTEEQLAILMRDLNKNRVSFRKQGGRQLSYLEAWDIKATLIRVFGFGGFSFDTTDVKVVDISHNDPEKPNKATVSVLVTGRLTIPQLGATFTESAASSQAGSQGVGDVMDFAVKTATSDALKRCAIFLGTQFGLSLYDNGSTSEVIKTIVAPGQEYWLGERNLPAPQQVKDQAVDNNVRNTPSEAEQDHPQFFQQDGGHKGAQPLSGAELTPEQKEANQRVMDKLGRLEQQGGQNG